MITRQSPFDGRGEDEILMKTLKAKLTFELPIFKQSSYELVGLINSIL